ncbi:GNAT family N-acetyltransferase [Gynuella sunshinyii]|uniref:Acetyltransferase n=1 Tax=Gynuella sunshinyii YC6258 TaxID=1445510 RepID=A0A0C5VC59_9GAMM|nr:GNAT family N-acetyltransferase [Gynuella sunshinyii]AJQ92097.1 acetyltransferase [Gynuella sunshinyii YC6258]
MTTTAPMIDINAAHPDQAEFLSDIAIEAKGHWGYSREKLDSWRNTLKVEPQYIRHHIVKTISLNEKVIGFFAIKHDEEAVLDHLWLLPEAIGKGIGKIAFHEALKIFRKLEIAAFTIISDPDAKGFYLHVGARQIGEVESIAQQCMLPKLIFELNETQKA